MEWRRKCLRAAKWSAITMLFLLAASSLWLFGTDSGTHTRYLLADSLIATQHREWAKYVIGERQLEARLMSYYERFERMGEVEDHAQVEVDPESSGKLVSIEEVASNNFKGYLVTIEDPTKLRVMVPERAGEGETVSSMVKRTGAILGVNAGAFIDPESKGDGSQPGGIIVSEGRLIYNNVKDDQETHIVGFDEEGRLVAGKYRPSELATMHIREAVTFAPKFIANGKGLIENNAVGWGIAPRTAIAQKEDGTIMILVIDGRQIGYSIGATLYEVQEIFLRHGAVTAANLDGGSSTVLVHENRILNQPASLSGERKLPTAWLLFDNPETVEVPNIWEGVEYEKVDPVIW